ncbi:MAG: 50S ribosomal protein L3 [Candidatus Hodgkinia cicadicola]
MLYHKKKKTQNNNKTTTTSTINNAKQQKQAYTKRQQKPQQHFPLIGFNVNTFSTQSGYIKVQHYIEYRHEVENEFGSILDFNWLLSSRFINLTSVSKGKGFAGVMKRHGFSGLRASHGVSLSHRSAGAIGARQDPGKVWKGKKMAGRLGGDKITFKKINIAQSNLFLGSVLIYGPLPGGKATLIRIFE